MQHVLTLPLSIAVSKKKEFILNLNNYRNAHYQTLNKAKINYKLAVEDQIKLLPKYDKVLIRYFLYPGSRRLTDVANVCCIHDKFLCDAIVEYGKLEDDNYLFLPATSSEFGSVDKSNPRVEAVISPLP